jgi:S-formylglutathione hydrolase FrmB
MGGHGALICALKNPVRCFHPVSGPCLCDNCALGQGGPNRSVPSPPHPPPSFPPLPQGRYVSASAFAPICNPSSCPWGEKAFKNYLGSVEAGAEYDASLLIGSYKGPPLEVLVDQGTADGFLQQKQLLPETLTEAVAARAGKEGSGSCPVLITLNMREGYDHSYNFISTFVDDHVQWFASRV